jgi:hypothetical protein
MLASLVVVVVDVKTLIIISVFLPVVGWQFSPFDVETHIAVVC